MLSLPDSWTWDFWLVQDDDGRRHMFFLYASRALHDPDRRHLRAGIGHAVSTDLRRWTRLADALVRADPPDHDDLATWTGSVVRADDGRWYLFYTGVTRRDGALLQRVALAVSDDLTNWHRHPANPLLAADPRWYEQLGESSWQDEHWRDPWVFRDPDGAGWRMLVTARARDGAPDERGVIGHATSTDLVDWTVGPPLSRPGSGFGQLEVPQLGQVAGRPVLVFSCLRGELAGHRQQTADGVGGIWAVPVDSPGGPFDVAAATLLTDDRFYAGRLTRDPLTGDDVLLAFRHRGPDGGFVGGLTDPMPVEWRGSRLVCRTPGITPDR